MRASTPPSSEKTATTSVTGKEPMDPALIAIIDRHLAALGDLHSAPKVVQDILRQTKNLDFDMRTLTETLASDPALSAKILRLVNSASFGLRHPVTAIPQAVMILGQRTLRLVVMTFSLVGTLTKGGGSKLYSAYWKNALTMAIVAKKLSRARTELDAEEAYSTGLLADLGILVLAQSQPTQYAQIYFGHPHDESLLVAEREAFGCDHAQIGSRLLTRWGFSPECAEAIRFHHENITDASDLELTIRTSALVSEMLWASKSSQLATVRSLLVSQFGFDTDKLISLAINCKEEIAAQADLYGVSVTEEIDVQRILDEARRLFVTASLETAMDLDSALAIMEDRPIDEPTG